MHTQCIQITEYDIEDQIIPVLKTLRENIYKIMLLTKKIISLNYVKKRPL